MDSSDIGFSLIFTTAPIIDGTGFIIAKGKLYLKQLFNRFLDYGVDHPVVSFLVAACIGIALGLLFVAVASHF